MKRRLTETSGCYRLPHPGELDKRVTFRIREDTPTGDYQTAPEYSGVFTTWAKVVQVGAGTYRDSVQTDDIVTHFVTIRLRPGLSADYELVQGSLVLRVKRARDLNSAGRFLLLECEELGHNGGNDAFI